MKKTSLCLLAFLLGAFALPSAYAQKQGLVNAAKKLAAKTAEKDLAELEKRFNNLKRFRSCQDLHRVNVLLLRSVPEDALREPLEELTRAGGYAQAADLVRAWRAGVPPSVRKPAPEEVGSLAGLRDKFSRLNVYRGPDLKRAADLFADARAKGLLTRLEYRNLLRSLSKRNAVNVSRILEGDENAVLYYHLQETDEKKALAAMEPLYAWEDLRSKSLALPENAGDVRATAIRRVLGPENGGVNRPLEKHKQFYDAQPPWKQAELDKKIDQMEARVRARAAQARAAETYNRARRLFVNAITNFFQGKTAASRSSLDVLLGPYASADLKRTVEKYWLLPLSSKEERAAFADAARALYDSHETNRLAGTEAADLDTKQAGALLAELNRYVRNARAWPEEGTDLFLRAERLAASPSQPVAAETVKRMKAAPPAALELDHYRKLERYAALHGKLPPADSPLYHALQRYKKLPGPYQKRFQELFERYRTDR